MCDLPPVTLVIAETDFAARQTSLVFSIKVVTKAFATKAGERRDPLDGKRFVRTPADI
jgi:hypothetical protein